MIQIALLIFLSSSATAQPALALLERTIALKHPVPQLKADSLATRLAARDTTRLLLLDVRRPDEFAISHIRGAVRVDPDLTADDFARLFADVVQGKELVFYCSLS